MRYKPYVYITRTIPLPGIELLSEKCRVKVHQGDHPPSKMEISRQKDAAGLLCLLTDTIDRNIIVAMENLKVISSYSVGYDHIDVAEATRRGIYVTNTPGVLTEATADFTWSLILTIARRVVEADYYVKGGAWKIPWSPSMLVGTDVHSKTLGIVGLGRIGSSVARRALGFNMKLLYSGPRRIPEREKELGIEYRLLEDLLGEADYVSIHVPLTRDTFHLLNDNRLQLMKPTAFLINTSRGPIVDEASLAKVLQRGLIAGAALDVYETEPINSESPLLKLSNVTLSPHIASATSDTRSKMAIVSAQNLLSVLSGAVPKFLVNPEVKNIRPLSTIKKNIL